MKRSDAARVETNATSLPEKYISSCVIDKKLHITSGTALLKSRIKN